MLSFTHTHYFSLFLHQASLMRANFPYFGSLSFTFLSLSPHFRALVFALLSLSRHFHALAFSLRANSSAASGLSLRHRDHLHCSFSRFVQLERNYRQVLLHSTRLRDHHPSGMRFHLPTRSQLFLILSYNREKCLSKLCHQYVPFRIVKLHLKPYRQSNLELVFLTENKSNKVNTKGYDDNYVVDITPFFSTSFYCVLRNENPNVCFFS